MEPEKPLSGLAAGSLCPSGIRTACRCRVITRSALKRTGGSIRQEARFAVACEDSYAGSRVIRWRLNIMAESHGEAVDITDGEGLY